jgi:hypothetical protein
VGQLYDQFTSFLYGHLVERWPDWRFTRSGHDIVGHGQFINCTFYFKPDMVLIQSNFGAAEQVYYTDPEMMRAIDYWMRFMEVQEERHRGERHG